MTISLWEKKDALVKGQYIKRDIGLLTCFQIKDKVDTFD